MSAVGWQKAESQKPDSDITVLIYSDESGDVFLGYWDSGLWRNVYGDVLTVSHWQDLPEPPETKKGGAA